MRTLLLTFLLLLQASVLAQVPGAPKHPVLRMGGFVVAPLMLGEADEPIRGALPEFIMKEIAPKTNIEFVWLPPMTFRRAMQRVKEGSIDVVLLVSGPPAQTPNVKRFGWAYLQTRPQLAVRPDASLQSIPDPGVLKGMSIGWVGGSRLPDELKDIPIRWELIYTPNWQTQNLRKLALQRIDAVFFGNQYSPAYLAHKENLSIRLLPLPMPVQAFEMAYSFHADQAAIAQFNSVAAQAFAGNGFKTFLENYGKRSDKQSDK